MVVKDCEGEVEKDGNDLDFGDDFGRSFHKVNTMMFIPNDGFNPLFVSDTFNFSPLLIVLTFDNKKSPFCRIYTYL